MAQELGVKTALNIIRRSLPEIIYLYASYFRRNARKFRAISEGPTLFHCVTLAAGLALVCVLASYAAVLLDPTRDFPGIMNAEQRAVWAALVPLLVVPPMYWLLRRHSRDAVFFTFLNLGFVVSAALMVLPSLVALAGLNGSSLSTDYANLRAGRADGTGVHRLLCGGLERQAASLALLHQQERIGVQLENALTSGLQAKADMEASRRESTEIRQRLLSSGGPAPGDEVLMNEYLNALRERNEVTRRAVERTRALKPLLETNIALIERSIDLENEQSLAFWRFAKSYPVATLFVALAWLVGMLLWLFAAVICWSLVVKGQTTKWGRRFAGTTVAGVFVTLMVGFGLLRSGMLEALVQETPSPAALQAQLKARYDLFAGICPRLDNSGLW